MIPFQGIREITRTGKAVLIEHVVGDDVLEDWFPLWAIKEFTTFPDGSVAFMLNERVAEEKGVI